MTIKFMKEADYCRLFMGFAACPIPTWFWPAAPLHAQAHTPGVAVRPGTAFMESNVTVHRKSLKMT